MFVCLVVAETDNTLVIVSINLARTARRGLIVEEETIFTSALLPGPDTQIETRIFCGVLAVQFERSSRDFSVRQLKSVVSI